MEWHIRSIRFNRDASHLICATSLGFQIYSVFPQITLLLDYPNLPMIAIAELSLPYIGIVTANHSKKASVCHINKPGIMQAEFCFTTDVINIRIVNNLLACVLIDKISIFTMSDGQLSRQIETSVNRHGLCDIAACRRIICCPGKLLGKVWIENCEDQTCVAIDAHKTRITNLAINNSGDKVVTCSEVGTIMRVFATDTGALLSELRRGFCQAQVFGLGFHSSKNVVFCLTDHGTLHIFSFDASPQPGWLGEWWPNKQHYAISKLSVSSNIPCALSYNKSQNVLCVAFLHGILQFFSSKKNWQLLNTFRLVNTPS
jgi:autophagy-related protein 18